MQPPQPSPPAGPPPGVYVPGNQPPPPSPGLPTNQPPPPGAYVPPHPPVQPPPPPGGPWQGGGPPTGPGDDEGSDRRWLPWALGGVAALLLVAIVSVLAFGGGDDDESLVSDTVDDRSDEPADEDDEQSDDGIDEDEPADTEAGVATATPPDAAEVTPVEPQPAATETEPGEPADTGPADTDAGNPELGAAPAGESDEIDDVGPCQFVDAESIVLDISNDSSEQSSYLIDVNFLDDGGQRLGDETFFVNFLRAGERTTEPQFVLDSSGGVACEVAEVDRFASVSDGNVGEVTCEITGLDFLDDIETAFTASNGSSELSDYFVTAALVRDGVRVGTSFGSIENVKPGESAPGDGFSTTDGPVDGVSCEIVNVLRTSSE